MSKDWVQVATQSKCTSWNNKEDFEKKGKKQTNYTTGKQECHMQALYFWKRENR